MNNLVISIQVMATCLLFIGLLGLCTGCQKDEAVPKPDLPPLTTEGKNTFGCYINGVPWKEGKPGFNLGGPTLEPVFLPHGTTWGDSIMSIRAFNYYYQDKIKLDLLSLRFRPKSLELLGIEVGKETFTRYFTEYQIYPGCIYDIDTTKVHEVHLIRFDLNERIASGTFEMTLYNTTNCNDTLVITDGRFDVSFTID